jgi:hypothetical protein
VDDDRLFANLPDALAVALRLHRAGHPDTVVATALGIPIEGVDAVIEVAEAKLVRLSQGSGTGRVTPENQ